MLALVIAVNGALALTWRLVSPGFDGYPAWFFTVNTAVTLLFVLGGWWLETSALQAGGAALARQASAREAWPASREAEHRLCNIVSELVIAASMKAPKTMVLPRVDSINAFAAGCNKTDAIVAVTQGALDRLSREELQGLLAHEFSHLREGDTRLNMRLAGMVYDLEMVFNLGQRMCELDDDGNRSFFGASRLCHHDHRIDGLAGGPGTQGSRGAPAGVSCRCTCGAVHPQPGRPGRRSAQSG